MTLDEIIAALKSTNAVPTAALAAGVAHADGIAPARSATGVVEGGLRDA
jgi:hypothetical protein